MVERGITLNYALWVNARRAAVPPPWRPETRRPLVAGAVWELKENKLLQADDRGRYRMTAELKGELDHLTPIYRRLDEAPPRTLEAHMNTLTMTAKPAEALADSCGEALQAQGLAHTNQSGRLISDAGESDALMAEVNRLLLSEEELTYPYRDLIVLLQVSGELKRGFLPCKWPDARVRLQTLGDVDDAVRLWQIVG